MKCSVIGSAVAQIKLCFSFKFNPLWFPFSVFIFQGTQKNTKMIRNAFEYEELGINKKLFSKQYKVSLIFQCYLILTLCYLNLSPPLFWILCAKKQTNKQTFNNNCPLLWSLIVSIQWFDSPMRQRPFTVYP